MHTWKGGRRTCLGAKGQWRGDFHSRSIALDCTGLGRPLGVLYYHQVQNCPGHHNHFRAIGEVGTSLVDRVQLRLSTWTQLDNQLQKGNSEAALHIPSREIIGLECIGGGLLLWVDKTRCKNTIKISHLETTKCMGIVSHPGK